MADMDVSMLEALKNLSDDEFDSLKHRLNNIKSLDGKTIPLSDLEKAKSVKVINKIKGCHFPNHVQVLIDVLKDINRKDLAEELRIKAQPEKWTSEAQIESESSPKKMQRLSEPESYDGCYRLSGLEAYAAKNQDRLIKQLEGYLKSSTMSKLKEQLARRKLKNSFEFTVKQCYKLYSNVKLEKFLKKISNAKKSQNMPKKIFSTLFYTIKSNNKDRKQNKENINSQLKYKQQKKPSVENNAESLRNMAIQKWKDKKKVENCGFDLIHVREHKKYSCFVTKDVILFKLPDDSKYCLLHILNEKDLESNGMLKKEVAFELQFNMAVLDVPSSDVISSVCDFSEKVQFDSNCTFKKFEEFFKEIVCKIILPLLALYKQVKVDLLQKTLDKERYSIQD